MWLFGLYLAEGYIHENETTYQIVIRNFEKEIQEKIRKIVKDIFGIEVNIDNEGKIIISSKKLINETSSKLLTKNLFDRYNLKYPEIYDKNSPNFPLISKPEFGSSGKNITIINSVNELSHELIS